MIVNRPRRLRATPWLRDIVRETTLSANDFIYPLFVIEGSGRVEPIESMRGQNRYTIDKLPAEIENIRQAGIKSVIIFGVPDVKDSVASAGVTPDNIVARAVQEIKRIAPELVVITDVCVCAYTDHGHCGIIHNREVDNDLSLDLLARMAATHALAGADIVAPSAMMDGQVAAIRRKLDEIGAVNTGILAYSAKYYSSAYGPFRDAAGSAPQYGDRAGYQMDAGNALEALREVKLDIEEGADMVMVKPALFYMDIIQRVREISLVPVVAYNVSGEYAMIKAAAEAGLIDENKTMLEMLTGMKRAGAGLIITYFAKQAALLLQNRAIN